MEHAPLGSLREGLDVALTSVTRNYQKIQDDLRWGKWEENEADTVIRCAI